MSRIFARAALVVAGTATLALLPATAALAHEAEGDLPTATRDVQVAAGGTGVEMEPVANLQYVEGGGAQNGSDIEFVKVGGSEYALAGTLRNGMQIVDITDPAQPRIAAVYDCKVSQGDIQVWRNGTRVLASYTADGTFGTAGAASQCAKDLGLDASAAGTVLVDITDPTQPRTVSYLPVPKGSHNMTIHPSGNYLYNSNSDLITSTDPAITIYDVSNPEAPRKVRDYPIPFVPLSLGSESHDITFNADGTRAYSAALSQTLVLDTTDPENPEQLGQIVDPAINVHHQADPVTLTRSDGTKRDVVVVTDERAGAAGSAECPGGGLHLYDITGDNEQDPRKIGTWFIPTVQPQAGTTCTSHVLRIHEDQEMLTIAWYGQGVRVLDISGLADFEGSATEIGLGDGVGMREVGNYVFDDSDTWSFKTNRIAEDGSFYGYGNDLTRGFDVYHFSGAGLSVPPLEPVDLAAPGKKEKKPHGKPPQRQQARSAPSCSCSRWCSRHPRRYAGGESAERRFQSVQRTESVTHSTQWTESVFQRTGDRPAARYGVKAPGGYAGARCHDAGPREDPLRAQTVEYEGWEPAVRRAGGDPPRLGAGARLLRGVAGTLAVGLTVLAAALLVVEVFGPDFGVRGPGTTMVLAHVLAAVLALGAVAVADRTRGLLAAVTLLVAVAVAVITLWAFWLA